MQTESFVLWFTGLSGSGKSTLAGEVIKELEQYTNKIEHLDGDTIRGLFPSTGFSKKERDDHIKRIGFTASLLEKHGVIVIASFISPFTGARNHVRNLCRNFIEVYVATPISECEKRDVKGLYSRARSGEVIDFTGIDHPYEAPEHPEIIIDTAHQTIEESTREIINWIQQRFNIFED